MLHAAALSRHAVGDQIGQVFYDRWERWINAACKEVGRIWVGEQSNKREL